MRGEQAHYLMGTLSSESLLSRWPSITTTFGVFVQNEWQPLRRMTLTLGIRFDNFGNPYPSAALNSIISNFYLGSGSDLTSQVANGSLKVTDHALSSARKQFSPRIGVSYDPTGSNKYVLRGGIGVYHEWLSNGQLTGPLRSNPPAFANPTFLSTQGIAPIFALGTSDTYPFHYPIPTVLAGVVTAMALTLAFLPQTSAAPIRT